MNIVNIISPNTKGQIVIPQKMRKSLGITADTLLQITQTGQAVLIHPIKSVVVSGERDNSLLLEILKKTSGAWANDKSWPKIEKERKVVELVASAKRKTAW